MCLTVDILDTRYKLTSAEDQRLIRRIKREAAKHRRTLNDEISVRLMQAYKMDKRGIRNDDTVEEIEGD